MLSRGRVADGEGVAIRAIHGDNEEAVARGRGGPSSIQRYSDEYPLFLTKHFIYILYV
jgi:hypothetical protein